MAIFRFFGTMQLIEVKQSFEKKVEGKPHFFILFSKFSEKEKCFPSLEGDLFVTF